MRIAISGFSGCGSTTASNNVAQALGLTVINYTMTAMSKEMGVTLQELQAMALQDAKYDYEIEKKQMELAEENEKCVIASRLAGWAIEHADLRVWLHASLETRAKRIASREKKPLEEVLSFTKRRDEENAMRYKKLYGVNVHDHDGFDLVVNTEYLTAEQVAALIVAAARLAKENNIPKPSTIAKHIREVIEKNLKEN